MADALTEAKHAVKPPDGNPLLWCHWPPVGECSRVAEQAYLSGWALDPDGGEVTVEVQAGRVYHAYHGLHRPDVADAHPQIARSGQSGWAVRVPVRDWEPGIYEVTVSARSNSGRVSSVTRYVEADPHGVYAAWRERRSSQLPGDDAGRRFVELHPDAPTFRVLMVGSDAGPRAERTSRSLDAQVYPRWQAHEVGLHEGLRRLGPDDVAVVVRAGDVVAPHALLEFARLLGEGAAPSVVYADHDLLGGGTHGRSRPFFTPEWSPELLLGTDYVGPFVCVTSAAAERALDVDPEPIESTYDLLLRLVDEHVVVRRIPDVLYSVDPDFPVSDEAAGERLVRALARRRGRQVRVHAHARPEAGGSAPTRTVRWELAHQPLVSIIIATAVREGFLARCIASIRSKTTYARIEVVLVVNGRGDVPSTLPDLDGIAHRVVEFDGPFNYSAINNTGAAAAEGEILVFLNDDTEIETPDWIEALLEQVGQPGVGIAGGHLVFPNGVVQLTGVIVLDTTDCATVTGMGSPPDDPGYQGLARVARNTSAVAGACMLMSKALFDSLGGFEEALPVELNDIDICLRALEAGQRVVLTPEAVLRHHFRGSRGALDHPSDHSRFRHRWRHLLRRGDPYHSPNLSTALETEGEPATGRRPPVRPMEEAEEAPHYDSAERFVPELMPGVIQAEHEGRYRWAAGVVAGKEVLDAGCGVGYGTLILARAGAARARGLDISDEAVADARFRAGPLADFTKGDLRALPFPDDSFDVVTCFEAIEHVEGQDRVLDEFRRVLRPGGLLLVSSPNRGVYAPGNPHHIHEYTAAELRAAVDARFRNVAMFRQSLWSVSLLTDDAGFTLSDTDQELEAALRKTSGADPGDEIYTIAMASDGPLPEPGRMAVLCDVPEIEGWTEQVAALRRTVRDLEEATRYLAGERELLSTRLQAIESSPTWRLASGLASAIAPLRDRLGRRGGFAG